MSLTSSATAAATATANPWVQILGALEKKINRHSYDTWLKPTRYSHQNATILFVRVPTPEFRHIGDKYADLIGEAMDKLGMDFKDVQFVTPEEDPTVQQVAKPEGNSNVRQGGGFAPSSAHASNAPVRNGAAAAVLPGSQGKFDWDTAAQLNPKYTFQNFVIGSGNQFAHAAS